LQGPIEPVSERLEFASRPRRIRACPISLCHWEKATLLAPPRHRRIDAPMTIDGAFDEAACGAYVLLLFAVIERARYFNACG
jgi:hypothetical protein